jgi:hypothetical protein
VLLPPSGRDGAARQGARRTTPEDRLKLRQRPGVGAEPLERLPDGGDWLDAAVGGAELVIGIVEAMIPATTVTRLEADGIEVEPEAPDP